MAIMSKYSAELTKSISEAISRHSIYSSKDISTTIDKLGSVDQAIAILDLGARSGMNPLAVIDKFSRNLKETPSLRDLELSSLWDIFIPPFKYESLGQDIWDDAGHLIANIRSWGYLTGMGALGLPEEKAAEIQDHFGRWIAAALTDCALSDRNGDNMPNSAAE